MAWHRDLVERAGAGALAATLVFSVAPARAADPIKIGLSLSLTGATAPAGRQVQAGLDIWRDHVNARGGLLGRQVELVYYDDQANPANAPGIYAKLMGSTRWTCSSAPTAPTSSPRRSPRSCRTTA
jgi:ABC-type branched-subunit amino acid transport system substrate-binding protein